MSFATSDAVNAATTAAGAIQRTVGASTAPWRTFVTVPAKPVSTMAKRALDRGLYLMTHWNVAMVCPPLTITREELDEGLAVLDEALSVADEFCT